MGVSSCGIYGDDISQTFEHSVENPHRRQTGWLATAITIAGLIAMKKKRMKQLHKETRKRKDVVGRRFS